MHAAPLASLLHFPGRSREELGGLVLVGRAPDGRDDHDLNTRQRIDDVTPDPSGRAGHTTRLLASMTGSYIVGLPYSHDA
jgi:hypothetical protein